MPDTSIRLATQGDDLGANHTTNLAFVEAFHKGILRNAAILVPGPAIEEAARLLAGEKELGISLHTDMNAEWDSVRWGPVAGAAKVPSLVDMNGFFFQTTQALWDNKPQVEHVLIELQAQLDRARELGFNVKFADAHMGWTWILKDHGPVFQDWRRKNGLLEHKAYGRLPEIHIMADPVERLILQLRRAQPGQYWIGGHPAYDNDEMRALGHKGFEGDMVAISREWERRIFTDPRIVEYCRSNGIGPIRHDQAV